MTLNCWFYCSSIPGGIRDVERRSEHELHFKEKVKSQSNVKTDCDSVRPFGFEPLLGLLTTTSSVCWDHCLWFFRHILRRGYGSLNLQNLPLLWGNVFTYTYIYIIPFTFCTYFQRLRSYLRHCIEHYCWEWLGATLREVRLCLLTLVTVSSQVLYV